MSTANDQERFLGLLQAHRGVLYKVAQVHCRRPEDRADLIQDMVVELWRSFARFDDQASFSTWMHRVGMNVAVSFYRSERRRIRDALPIEDVAMDLAAADRHMEAQGDDLRALHQLIQRLDEVNRALILLYLEGHGQDEIARMLGLSATNVATRVGRIKQQLQREYAAESNS